LTNYLGGAIELSKVAGIDAKKLINGNADDNGYHQHDGDAPD
jgi:hypothetical protein